MESLNNSGISLKDFWPVMKEVIESGGEFTFYPHGTSMLPLIRQGKDQVVLVKPENIKVGDMVFYQRDNGQFVLHRLVKIAKNQYVMCGDNQYDLEYGITDKHILAKVKAVIRDGKIVDETIPQYRSYVKKLAFKRFKMHTRLFLSKIKRKIFK